MRKAPEAEGEFGKGNEPLQGFARANHRSEIVDITEYPEVQRND
jgi:hypothetical protein